MKVVVAGAGGQARVVLGILSHYPDIEVAGVADRTSSTIGQTVGKASIVACWDELPDWRKRGIDAIVLALGDNAERQLMYNQVLQMGYEVLGIRHPTSIVERGASVGPASILCAGSIICSDAEIRENVIINTGSIVEHECKIASHAHIGPGVRIGGRVSVGERSFLGIGSCVIEKKRIGRDVILGAGSVVLCDLPDDAVAYGVPARIREQT
jgi:sugar O-acyltransferase (sialic acid O-acetyltransferase NeuD family)